ncbi:hypothetical protein AGMMS49938_07010 [Fibrobacterales bacterium]|nr:hypothetical protein AGMMS49938_07010 [Fibrobacterales bacterium]
MFTPSLGKLTSIKSDDFVIAVCRDRVAVDIKTENNAENKNPAFDIGNYNGKRVVALSLSQLNGGQHLREILAGESAELAHICSLASHLVWWRSVYKFCPTCKTVLKESETERSLICESCGQSFYPVIAPAIIVSVVKDKKILLAHNAKFPEGRYSLVAGFVEAAENLENAVRREVLEEVGIRIKNLRYLESENWSFPNSLMTAFTAEWESGEITPDGVEITSANWFSPAEPLPDLPPKGSVARRVIERFLD